MENEAALGTPVAVRLEDPSRALVRSAAGASGTAASQESAPTTSVAQARGVAPQSKTARARAAGGLVAGEHAVVVLPGGKGVGRHERGGGGGRREEEELWVRQEVWSRAREGEQRRSTRAIL